MPSGTIVGCTDLNYHVVYHPETLKHKRPIMMIHGMFGTHKRWGNYVSFFNSKGFRVITPNLRYHYQGNNKEPKLGRMSVNDYVDDIGTSIEYLMIVNGWPRPIVIGHSMGGLIAQKVAEAGLAEKLVLLNSAPPAGTKLHPDPAYQLAIIRYLPWILLRKPFKPNFKIYSRFTINNMPKNQHKEIYENVVYESGRAAFEMRFSKIKVDFQKITCPTLIVSCEKDRMVPPKVAMEIHEKMRRASFWTYLKFAHWIQSEPGWEKPAQDIFEWLVRK